jgi:hypothetical protein
VSLKVFARHPPSNSAVCCEVIGTLAFAQRQE